MAGHYNHIIDGWWWSYTKLSSFDDCPYKWFLRYIKCCDEEPCFYTTYGSFVHGLIELYNKGILKKEELASAFLDGFSDEVQGVRPKESTVVKYIKTGVDYFDNFEPFPYKMIDVEKKIFFTVEKNKFISIVDYIGEDDNGDLIIIDHKSRELKPRSNRKKPTLKDKELDSMLRQLYLYSAGIKQEYGRFPKTLAFNCFRNREFITEPFNKNTYDSVIKWAENQIKYIKKQEIFNPNIEPFFCRNLCGTSNDCCYYDMAFGR